MKQLNKKGFTLIELLVAISILGLITIIALPQINNLKNNNKETKYKKYADSLKVSAKLYTDSYSEDMFGYNASGCYDIPYSKLKDKDLVKDIKLNGESCAGGPSAQTYVRVYKSNTNYNYGVSLYCFDSNNKNVYSKLLNEDEVCDGTTPDKTAPEITLSPESSSTWKRSSAIKVKITIADPYGMLENTKIKYVWTKTPEKIYENEYKEYNFKNKRYDDKISLTVKPPKNITGNYYLVVKPVDVRDANGNYQTFIKRSGIFKIDDIAPKVPTVDLYQWSNNSTRPTSPTGLTEYVNNTWSKKKVYTVAESTDEGSGIDYYEYTTTGATTNVENEKGTYRSVEADGISTIKYRACDKAGNCSDYGKAYTIKVDKTAPKVPTVKLYKWTNNTTRPSSSSGLSAYTNNTWSNKKVYTTAISTDSGSGIDHYEYTTTGATTNNADKQGTSRNIEADGTSYIKYRACDKVGNCSAYSTQYTVKVDKTAPTLQVNVYKLDSNNNKINTSNGVPISNVGANDDAKTQSLSTYGTSNSWLNKEEFPNGVYYEISYYDNISVATTEWSWNKTGLTSSSAGVNEYTGGTTTTTVNSTEEEEHSAAHTLTGQGYRKAYYKVTDQAGNSVIVNIIAPIDRTAPTIPTVNLYKWTNNSTRPTSESGLLSYTSNTWSNKKIFTKASGSSDKISGLKEYRYTTTGKTTNVENEKGTYRSIEADGVSTIKYRACDNAGNCSDYGTSYTVKVDKTAPSIPNVNLYKWTNNTTRPISSSGLTGYQVNQWTNSNIFTTASGSTDSASGFDHYEYTTTGATENVSDEASDYRSIEASGTSYIKYRACDSAGNCSAYSDAYTVKLDKQVPTCVSSGGNENWTKSDVTLTGKCSDSLSGCTDDVSRTYTTDTNTTTGTPGAVYDKAGNSKKCPNNQIVKIDKTPPTCTHEGDSTIWTKSNRTIKYGCNDLTSGCNTSYSGGSKTFSSTVKTSKMSSYVIKDIAGNETTCPARTANVYVDKTPPTLTIAAYPFDGDSGTLTGAPSANATSNGTTTSLSQNWLNKSNYPNGVYYGIVYSDNVSVATTEWAYNKTGRTASSSDVNEYSGGTKTSTINSSADEEKETYQTLSGQGYRKAYFKVTDKAGNVSKVNITAPIDRTAPKVTKASLANLTLKQFVGSTYYTTSIKNKNCTTSSCSATLCLSRVDGSFIVDGEAFEYSDTMSGPAGMTPITTMYDKNNNVIGAQCLLTDGDNPCKWVWNYTLKDNALNSASYKLTYTVGYFGDGSGC